MRNRRETIRLGLDDMKEEKVRRLSEHECSLVHLTLVQTERTAHKSEEEIHNS